jgi:hypothetical protein
MPRGRLLVEPTARTELAYLRAAVMLAAIMP